MEESIRLYDQIIRAPNDVPCTKSNTEHALRILLHAKRQLKQDQLDEIREQVDAILKIVAANYRKGGGRVLIVDEAHGMRKNVIRAMLAVAHAQTIAAAYFGPPFGLGLPPVRFYYLDGMHWLKKGEYDIAITDFDEAIRLLRPEPFGWLLTMHISHLCRGQVCGWDRAEASREQ